MAETAFVTEDDNRIGTIVCDAVVREGHSLSAEPTEHPVEGGGIGTTDHVHQRPDVLVLDCVVSNTPINQPLTQDGGTRPVREAVTAQYREQLPIGLGPLNSAAARSVTQRVTVQGWSPGFDRRSDVWKELRKLKEASEPITVVTSLEVYTDMVIQEISDEVTAQNGRSLEFTITLKKIRVAFSAVVDAPEMKKPKTLGRTETTEATPEEEERVSAAYKALSAAGIVP